MLLVGTRGNPPTPPPDARPSSVFREPRGKHSAKPEGYYALIEAMYPGAARIEGFARQDRIGWDHWGNQAG
jgi:N6-adenosine-specific RNA methylase IME4